MMARKKTIKSLNDVVDMLVDNAYHFWRWKLIAAQQQTRSFDKEPKGIPKGYYTGYDHEEMDRVIAIITPLLAAAQQTRTVEAQTSKDIVKLVSSGKISIDEATKLMTLTKIRLDVEEKELKKDLQAEMLKVFNDEIEEDGKLVEGIPKPLVE